MKSDFHMHTDFSTDATASPRSMIQGAIDKGLKTICITEHQDMDFPGEKGNFQLDTKKYFELIEKLKIEFADKIEVRIGVEIGLQPTLGPRYKTFVNQYPFDFVIGSVHVVHGMDPYEKILFEGKTDTQVYEETFLETIKNIHAIQDYDVLGHIDYIVRYGNFKAKEYSYAKFAPYIDEILRHLIKNGKGIELNMSGFKYDLGFPHPHPDILKRYKELGGEIITVGADGHKPEHIAYDFHKVYDILKTSGFKYYTEFKERKPIFQQLP